MFTWWIVRAGVAAGAAVALAAGLGGAGQASTASRGGGPGIAAVSPFTAAGVQAALSGVSCKGRSFCMAIGSYSKPGRPAKPLAEEWNGKSWRTVPDPLPGSLSNVTCGSPTFCFAERTQGLTTVDLVQWNGRTWRTMKNQPPPGQTVFCLAPRLCVASPNGEATVQAWDGRRWAAMPGSNVCDGTPPNTECGWNGITCGTSCIGSYLFCVFTDCANPLTGTAGFTITGGWKGISMPLTPSEVGCAGPSFCLITSGATAFDAQNIENRDWHDVTPDFAVACHGAANCTLVGTILSCGYPAVCMALSPNSAVTLALNGTTWTAPPLAPVHGRIPQLVAMSCGSARNCAAVGTYQLAPRGPTHTAAEHWNGTAWLATTTPST